MDDERCFIKAHKVANFELLSLHHLKFQMPLAWELNIINFQNYNLFIILTQLICNLRYDGWARNKAKTPQVLYDKPRNSDAPPL